MSKAMESVTSNLVPDMIRVREKKSVEYIADEVGSVKEVTFAGKTTGKIAQKTQVYREPTEVIRFVPLPTIEREFNTKADYLKSLQKGSVVCLRGWALGPFESVGVVWRCTPTSIILTNGKKFDKFDGMPLDGSKQMITPLSQKAKSFLVSEQRKRLHIKEAA